MSWELRSYSQRSNMRKLLFTLPLLLLSAGFILITETFDNLSQISEAVLPDMSATTGLSLVTDSQGGKRGELAENGKAFFYDSLPSSLSYELELEEGGRCSLRPGTRTKPSDGYFIAIFDTSSNPLGSPTPIQLTAGTRYEILLTFGLDGSGQPEDDLYWRPVGTSTWSHQDIDVPSANRNGLWQVQENNKSWMDNIELCP
jgi:hypothetical protein